MKTEVRIIAHVRKKGSLGACPPQEFVVHSDTLLFTSQAVRDKWFEEYGKDYELDHFEPIRIERLGVD